MSKVLWVLGTGDANLGQEVVTQALGMYDHVFGSNEQTADVTSTEHLRAFLYNHIMFESDPDGLLVSELHVAYCAGVNLLDRIEDISPIDLQQTFDVNVMGFINLLKVLTLAASGVTTRKWAHETDYQPVRFDLASVVAVASDAARNPMRNSIAYCASKAALVQAVRVAARELAPKTRVNSVSPAIIDDTPMTWMIDKAVQAQRGWSEEEARDYERSLIPMRRRAYKHEVASVILQTLAGPEFLTGSNIEITGGK